MREARIDMDKETAKGLGFGESVTIKMTGKVTGVDTYDLTETPMDSKEDKKPKEKPRVTVKIGDYTVSIDGKTDPKKAYDKKYKEEMGDKEDK
ncbi:MAG: hypothetical protein U9R38_03080 [Candidatus Margulisiibacteriota bacterium]|nr:hypothetical protein [Candidatus Margulisiibacteriota bacterium]